MSEPQTEVNNEVVTDHAADTLYERAKTRQTALLGKLNDLSDEEWDELTHRMSQHFQRELNARGLMLVSRLGASTIPVEPLREAVAEVRKSVAFVDRGGEFHLTTDDVVALLRAALSSEETPT